VKGPNEQFVAAAVNVRNLLQIGHDRHISDGCDDHLPNNCRCCRAVAEFDVARPKMLNDPNAKLLENIAAISAEIHRNTARHAKFCDRMARQHKDFSDIWKYCIEAARLFTKVEAEFKLQCPRTDYEWIDSITDFAGAILEIGEAIGQPSEELANWSIESNVLTREGPKFVMGSELRQGGLRQTLRCFSRSRREGWLGPSRMAAGQKSILSAMSHNLSADQPSQSRR
jgi:hypothetical protein